MSHRLISMTHRATAELWQPVARARIASAKRSFATRRIDLDLAAGLIVGDAQPATGDLALVRVDALGQHRRLEDPCGRRANLYVGDEILVAYGERYAPDQFEAAIPETLRPCALVAGGGIVAEVLSKSASIKNATRVTPIGLVTDAAGERLNTKAFRLQAISETALPPKVVAVVGASMNAGKTTALASLIRGETAGGSRVGAAKITGTGSGGDLWAYRDAGASIALDFTDAGHPTTSGLGAEEIERTLRTLVGRLAMEGVDIAFIEIADGLLFRDTATLVLSDAFRTMVDRIVFAAGDAMSALYGAEWLISHGLPLAAISGAATASPLSVREIEAGIDVPVVGIDDMVSGAFLISALIDRAAAA